MEESSLLKIVSEKWVKPSSPTPPSSRYYKLSAFDLYVGDSLIPMAFFYPRGSFHGGNASITELFEMLEISLSKTLTHYYPFAGRFMNDNITVDCNDAGVKVWEVQVQASMSEILDNRVDDNPWNSIFLPEMSSKAMSHVKIQLNYFECGGICVIVSLSHKLADSFILGNFVRDWGVIARASQEVVAPVLSGGSIFPPPNDCPNNNPYMVQTSSNLVTQRFVFSTSSICDLKKQVEKETEITNLTQDEVVTALIFKSAMSAAAKKNSFKPSSLVQILNFRPLTIPPLSMDMVGNFVNTFTITVAEEKEMALSRIVTELRKSKVKYVEAHNVRIEGNEFMDHLSRFQTQNDQKLKGNNFDMYMSASCCGFPYYEVDFGFGKPIFVCRPGGLIDRILVLMDTPNGEGIDAVVTLKSDHMSIFENDEELLAFASLNPIIYVARP